jgi:hypothetical protein
MIVFRNLLEHHGDFSIFWKTILERLSVRDAPFFSNISENTLKISSNFINLKQSSANEVVDFCKQQWGIVDNTCVSWKDVKKDNIRVILLSEYIEKIEQDCDKRRWLLFEFYKRLTNKTILAEDITIKDGKITYIQGLIP